MSMSVLTLDKIVECPDLVTSTITVQSGQMFNLRTLVPSDVDALTDFLGSLSPRTRQRWVVDDYGKAGAQEMCDAIGRFDKLRLVVAGHDEKVIGLMEFSLRLVPFDMERFANYGIELNEDQYIRFGPCVRDEEQQKGIFSATMPYVIDIAQNLGKEFIILWGGVLSENIPAIKSYKKLGFYEVGRFNDRIDGSECLDMVLEIGTPLHFRLESL